MSDETKDPTPEAIEVALLRRESEPVTYDISPEMRVILDKWGAEAAASGKNTYYPYGDPVDNCHRLAKELEAEKGAHAVTRSRLEFLEGYRSVVEPELESVRKEWAKQEHIANEHRAQNEELDLKLQDLESLRKPLEGEPQPAEPPEPRPIVVGSKWEHRFLGAYIVDKRSQDGRVVTDGAVYSEREFRGLHRWLSDPPAPTAECHHHRLTRECHERKPATPASRKVEPGTSLQVGARYRITEIASWDDAPGHTVGDCFDATGANCVWLTTCSTIPASWILDAATYVTGLELVEEKDTKK